MWALDWRVWAFAALLEPEVAAVAGAIAAGLVGFVVVMARRVRR